MNGPSRQRREEILTEVLEKRHVTARDLAMRMNVSEATVRRDLKLLAEEGQLELVYGGATPAPAIGLLDSLQSPAQC